MRKTLDCCLLVLFSLYFAGAPAVGAEVTRSDGKFNLRILYAGHPGSDREKDFLDFLTTHFKAVQTEDLKGLRETKLKGYDVAILDYDGDGFKAPRPAFSRDCARPIVTMGVAGAFIGGSWGLKTGYL